MLFLTTLAPVSESLEARCEAWGSPVFASITCKVQLCPIENIFFCSCMCFISETKLLWDILFQFSLEQTHLRVEPLMENPILDDLVLCKGHVLLGLSGAQVSQRGLGIAHS